MNADEEFEMLLGRISVDPRVMGGLPMIRDTRVHFSLILNLTRNGYSFARIVEAYPHLTEFDVKAALAYAESRLKPEQAPTLRAS